jgi:hypothetical protein
MLFLAVETEKDWIKSISDVPILGHIFVFALIFIPAVICSFIAQALIPYLHNDIGFTKAILVLLPAWNAIMWFSKIKLFIFFLPSWIVLGVIAIVKIILMLNGVEQ